jgi:glycerophosphoryl diester phosphodiesterase
MLLIAHRGNLTGPNPNEENKPSYIQKALDAGFSVEIDLRVKDDKLYLGHDYAQYPVSEDFLIKNKSKFWVHCKDNVAFTKALQLNLNCFWHNTDDYTMTSYGYVWCYPNKLPVGKMSVTVLPEMHDTVSTINKDNNMFAVCSDYVLEMKDV